MMAKMEYTTVEHQAIIEFRKRMAGAMSAKLHENTHLFYRFLKARDFKLDLAEAMLRKHLDWRKEFGVDTILDDVIPLDALVKYFPGSVICFDKDGCPVKYFAFGSIDPKGIRSASRFMDMVKFMIHNTEKEIALLEKQGEKVGKVLPGSVYIFDFKDITFSQVSDKKMIEHTIYFAKLYQDNYPERLKAAYCINVSPYFTFLFNIIKVFLASTIIKKLHFASQDEFKDKLLNVIDAEQLPAFLGGTRTDPDGNPRCTIFVNHAGKIPDKYFINKDGKSLSKKEGAKKLVLSRSSVTEIELEVQESGSLIEWEFEIKSKDIDFGLFLKENSQSRPKEIVPLQRIGTEEFSETGIHKCETPGIYILLFGNSFSWWRSKEIYYIATVKNPRDLESGFTD